MPHLKYQSQREDSRIGVNGRGFEELTVAKLVREMENEEDEQANKIVESFLKGQNISQLPMGMFARVHIVLEQRKNAAIRKGNVDMVKAIHKVVANLQKMEQFQKMEENRKKSALPPLRRRSSMRVVPNEVCEEYLQEMLRGKPFDRGDGEILPDLIQHTKNQINMLINEQQFVEAQKREDVLRNLLVVDIENKKENTRFSKRDQIARILSMEERKLVQMEENYANAIYNFDQNFEQNVKDTYEKDAKELEDFDKETDEGMPATCRKFSQRLLNIREKEKNLVASKRYAEAAAMKDEGKELEEQEEDILFQNWLISRDKQRSIIIEAQEANLRCIQEKAQRNRTKIVLENEENIEAKKKAIENIRRRLNELDSRIKLEAANATSRRTSRGMAAKLTSRCAASQKSLQQYHLCTAATQTKMKYRYLSSLA